MQRTLVLAAVAALALAAAPAAAAKEILVVGGGVAAVPSARSAVLRWLGIEGVRIERVPVAPTPAPPVRRCSTSASRLGSRPTMLVPTRWARPTRSTPRASG